MSASFFPKSVNLMGDDSAFASDGFSVVFILNVQSMLMNYLVSQMHSTYEYYRIPYFLSNENTFFFQPIDCKKKNEVVTCLFLTLSSEANCCLVPSWKC